MPTFTPESWQQISPYLDQLLDLREDQRHAWLEAFARTNPELAELLSELLKEHAAVGQQHFLEGTALVQAVPSSLAGQKIGAYTLISPIGQGGMGTVWLAERNDGRFERRVAVKVLRFSVASQGGAERFRREGMILGQLAHSCIAELIDAGVTAKGEPYLVLENVAGEHIDEYCDKRCLPIEARIRLFLDVLSAVAHAHANLIVHRDLKPSNVLVRTDSQVKLLDFGIAKLLAADGDASAMQLTQEVGSALTLQFAAPEQVTGGAITTATDVYSLGVLLYLLLTGRHAAGDGQCSAAELVKAITETEPARASDALTSGDNGIAANRGSTPEKLGRELRGDLDTILSKALKKNPAERYGSVVALAEDLQHYLRDEPISARPDSFSYRSAKFVRRNRMAVALTAIALSAVVAGSITTVIQSRNARRQRDFAIRQLARAEKINDLNRFLLTDAQAGKPLTVEELMQRAEGSVRRENYTQDPANHVLMLVSLAAQYCQRDRCDKALPLDEEAYRLSRTLRDPSARAQAACALADALVNQYSRAESLIQEGLRELPDDQQFAPDRAFCLVTGGDVARSNDNDQQALARFLEAQQLLRKSTFASQYLRFNVEAHLADTYLSFGQLGKAIATYERISQLLTDLGYDQTVTAVQNFTSWGDNLLHAGRVYEAHQVLHRALEIATNERGIISDPSLLNAYGDALRLLERYGEALVYAKQGYARARELNDELLMNNALQLEEQIYREQGNVAQARAVLADLASLHGRDQVGSFNSTKFLSEESLLAQAEGNFPLAVQLADQVVSGAEAAINSGQGGGQALALPYLLLRRSGIELDSRQLTSARMDAERAVSLLQARAEPGTFSLYVGRGYLSLGRALRGEGKLDQARTAFLSAKEQIEHAAGPDHPDARVARELAAAALP